MNRRGIVIAWAGLCLAGIAATAALNAEPYTAQPESPAGEPTPTATYTVDCRRIGDDIERGRAEAKRRQQEALKPSGAPAYQGRVIFTDVAVPEECVDHLKDRGLWGRDKAG
ncbi:hypothetical protein [Streptomyces botrytidirepellens]|uniref:Secreted protein n=1 Tax=Streptomyces botrytidirepellens TaxID=2486417 RepID=A0A3M8VJQ7_9ACTN|nr:hypothetical protein [Streptomyces botrytidirepellens]RNG17816.1 hypothetical protein EEJ42_29260 [Streptomyces botrytidirepellens]